jgi:hypothetical protein
VEVNGCTPAVTTGKIEGIPLFLIPNAISILIRRHGDAILRIQVDRKFHHRYTVNAETLTGHSETVNPDCPVPEGGDGHG